MTIGPLPVKAPISQRLRTQFERDVSSVNYIIAAAERKGNTCGRWEASEEYLAARDHFELGCWLHYYADRVGKLKGFQDRVDCVRRIWESGIHSGGVGYRFFSVFGFGERHFDTCFEMGDGDKVADALKEMARQDPDGPVAAGAKAFGWELRPPVVVVADALDRLGEQLEVPKSLHYSFSRRYETTWYEGGPGQHLSAFIRPNPGDGSDAIEGEIRVFLDEPRAMLFMNETAVDGNRGKNLLPGQDAHVRAESYDALLVKIVERCAPLLAAVAEDANNQGMKP